MEQNLDFGYYELSKDNQFLLKIVSEWSKLDCTTLVNNALTLYFKEVQKSLEFIAVNGNSVSAYGD